MNYLLNYLWLGALFEPKCWACAVKRNPMMLALFAAISFCIGGFSKETCVLLSVFWVFGMVVFIITPRRCYKLQHNGKVLYLFFYDAYSGWKINIADEYRNAILRVFEKDGQECRLVEKGLRLQGFDDYLEPSGFILVKPTQAEWMLLGNGYSVGRESRFLLGFKIANYAFMSGKKKVKLHFIREKIVTSLSVESYEKCNTVSFSKDDLLFKPLDPDAEQNHPLSLARVEKAQGQFLLVTADGTSRVFKLVTMDGFASCYQVFTKAFHFRAGKKVYFLENPENTGVF